MLVLSIDLVVVLVLVVIVLLLIWRCYASSRGYSCVCLLFSAVTSVRCVRIKARIDHPAAVQVCPDCQQTASTHASLPALPVWNVKKWQTCITPCLDFCRRNVGREAARDEHQESQEEPAKANMNEKHKHEPAIAKSREHNISIHSNLDIVFKQTHIKT